jgi:hypothetical protein
VSTPVSILIAWRDSGDPDRQANLIAVLDHLVDLDWPIVLADDGRENGQPFNRSAAFNHGMRLSPSDVYVFHEADMLVPLDQLADGVVVAERRVGLVVPFTRWRALGPEATYLARSGMNPDSLNADRIMDDGRAVGAVGVASTESMALVGRWDERFEGHGYDDRAMYHAFRAACGPGTYVEGDAHALWHPPAYSPWERVTAAADAANYTEADVQATAANRARMRRYLACETPEDVRALTTEGA